MTKLFRSIASVALAVSVESVDESDVSVEVSAVVSNASSELALDSDDEEEEEVDEEDEELHPPQY
ncbi:hypothetical protein [Cocleimonas flava]|uniref:hypothetical protein n=1 Tax=Cocleimonas flava TaxID=634765 RepID=UPI0010514C60|nr:hypothetical protein [Cocleimonas flava]